MSLESDIELLSRVPFFHGLPEDQLRLLAFSAEARTMPEHMVLYEQGQALHSGYVVSKGLFAGTRGKGEGAVTREIGPGTILAERALIVESRALETVRVKQAATALQLRRPVFHRFLAEYPQAAVLIRQRMAQRFVAAAADYRRTERRLGTIKI